MGLTERLFASTIMYSSSMPIPSKSRSVLVMLPLAESSGVGAPREALCGVGGGTRAAREGVCFRPPKKRAQLDADSLKESKRPRHGRRRNLRQNQGPVI